MPHTLTIQNRQRTRAVETRLLRQIVDCLLTELLQVSQADLGLILVATLEMARVNEQFLKHKGSTDVITFNHASGVSPPGDLGLELHVAGIFDHLKPQLQILRGELFVCVDEALIQAQRFRTTWQAELVRYVIHGVLHLRGFDDCRAAARRVMKREENRLLRILTRRFNFNQLTRARRRSA